MSEEAIVNSLLAILKELEVDTEIHSEQFLVEKYDRIQFLLPSPKEISTPLSFYRARLVETVTEEQSISSIETFSYIPLRYNLETPPKPSRGRMNLTGQSVFYASSSPQTNFKEIKKDVKEGDEVYLSKWDLRPNSVMNTYSVIMSDKISETANPEIDVCITDPHIVNGRMGEYLRCFSDMLLLNDDNEEKKYLLSSCIAYNLFRINNQYKKGSESFPLYYDAIAYPSVQSMNGEYNWAIKPEFVDKHIQLKYVVKGVVKADLQSVDFRSIGFYHDNEIIWYETKVDAKFECCYFVDDKGKRYASFDYSLKDALGKNVFYKDIEYIFETKKDEIVGELVNQGAFIGKIDYKDVVDESSLIKSGTHPLFIPVNGWTMEIDGKRIGVSNIGALLLYKTWLKK